MAEEEKREIGEVTHYFTHLSVAVVKLADHLKVGDEVHIKGATTDFTQKIDSMQIHGKDIREANKGESVGMKVKDRVREGDKIFLADAEKTE